MEREAQKKREYAARTKIDVKDILTDQEARQIKVANKDQDQLLRADPSSGDLLTAEHHYEGDDTDLLDDDDEDFDPRGDDTLQDLVKDPYSKKQKQK